MQLLVLFFFLMLFMPTAFQGPRAIILLLLIISTIGKRKPLFLNSEVKFYWGITFFVALYSLLIGAARGNVGLIPCTPFYIIWPVIFLYFIAKCSSLDTIKILLRTIVYGGFIVAGFNFLLIVNAFVLHIGILNIIGEALGCNFNIVEGFAEYFSPSGNHLPYIVYFCVSLLMLKPEELGVRKKYLYICIALCIIDILLSNRRAMWLVVVMLPFVLLAILSFLPYHKRIIFKVGFITILGGGLIFGAVYYLLDMDYIIQEFLTSFDVSGDDDSNYERVLQGKSLWNDFLASPIFGGGIGHVSSYVRTPDGPWAYEMTYNYTLAMVGIVGSFIYAIATSWIFIRSIQLSKKNIEYASLLIPQIMGLAAVLIISASNPYIVTFDYVWAIYLPVATINAIRNEQRKAKASLGVY